MRLEVRLVAVLAIAVAGSAPSRAVAQPEGSGNGSSGSGGGSGTSGNGSNGSGGGSVSVSVSGSSSSGDGSGSGGSSSGDGSVSVSVSSGSGSGSGGSISTISVPHERAVGSRFAPWPAARAILELDVITQGRATRRAGDDLSEVRLERGEAGARIGLGKRAAAELRMEALRSAADGGALGIDGDSTVLRVKLAQVMAMHDLGDPAGTHVRLEGAFGVVPDPWIRGLEEDYTLRPLSRTGSERFLGWSVADLSMLVRASLGPVRATASIGNGEGLQYPERNRGKTTTIVLDVVPIHAESVGLTVRGVVRDGSRGVASIRDRRAGGAVTLVTPWVRAGAELVVARGIGDRAAAEGVLVGGWADAKAIAPVFLAARAQTLGFGSGGGRLSSFGGGVAVEPWREPGSDRARGRMRLWLGVEHETSSGGATPLPGADAGDATLLMLIASATAPFALE